MFGKMKHMSKNMQYLDIFKNMHKKYAKKCTHKMQGMEIQQYSPVYNITISAMSNTVL